MKRIKIISILLSFSLVMSNFGVWANAQTINPDAQLDSTVTGRNLKQSDIAVISKMPQLPLQAKVIDWNSRGNALDQFLFDWNWQQTSGRKFATIFKDTKYGGYLMPSFYGETRPLDNPDKEESITLMGALLGGSLLGNKKDIQNPMGQAGETYLDSAKKYFWAQDGIFTNFPDQSTDPTVYNDLWYLLISNQNFYRLSSLYPNWDVSNYQSSVANKLCGMVDVLGGQNCNFNIQAFNFNTMQPKTGGWSQPDAAAGTANILYYAYQKFGDAKYLTYAKYCMDYLEKLDKNPYYENMLIDASYVAARMNAEVGTNYNIAKYLNWITGTDSSVRNWGGVQYTQDGRDVYGLTGEARGDRQYAFFFNSVYPMTSILPTAKYDPSYAKAAGKWALNIVSSARYFLPSEWPAQNQSDPEFKGKPEENVLAYEGFKKYSEPGKDGPNVTTKVNFMGTGDAMMNATTGWQAGKDVTNLGVYGSVYTEFLGALVEKTNVDNILKLDCNKTDYFQKSMYPTYLYYNPYNEPKMVDITLSEPSDLYDSVTGTYLAKNVTGKQSFKILADSSRVIVITPPDSSPKVTENTTTINGKLVAHSTAETLPAPTGIAVSSIQIQSANGNQITRKSQQLQLTAQIMPADAEDTRVIWSVTNLDGSQTDKAAIDSNGLLTAQKNGDVKVTAVSMDESNVSAEKIISVSGQTLPSLSYGKNVAVSSQNGDFGGNLAVDGNSSTRWIANPNETNPWIRVDLGATATIDSIVLNWEAARPPKYRVEVSDDAQTWTLVQGISDSGNSAKVVTIQPSTPVTARYVRVYTEQKSSWGASMYEFEVNGAFQIDKPVTSMGVSSTSGTNTITTKNRKLQMTASVLPADASDSRVEWYVYNEDGSETDIAQISATGLLTPLKNGTVRVTAKSVDGSNVTGSALVKITGQNMVNLSLGGTAAASQSEPQNQPAGAIDGNYTTRWASGTTNGDASLTIDLKQAYPVSKVVLTWEAAYAPQYKIQGSLDGAAFTDLYVQSNGQGGTEEISLSAPQKVRYLRMQGVKNKPGLGYSLYEVEAYTTDKSILQSIVSQNASLTKGCYTDASWAQFLTALQSAQNYLADEMSSQDQIDKAAGDLNSAAAALREKTPAEVATGITGLNNPKKGDLQLELPHEDGYEITIHSSDNPTVIALNASISPLEKDVTVEVVLNVSRNGINAQTQTFSILVPGIPMPVDKGQLTAALTSAQKIDKNLYTEASYQVLSSAIQSAQAVLQNADAAQDVVDGACTTLQQASSGLKAAADKTDLQKLYNDNKDKANSNYTEATWNTFQQALNTAKTILQNADAAQDEVDGACTTLQQAVSGLKVVVDKTDLQKLYDDNKNKANSNYTEATWNAFQEALNAAKAVLQNADATQEQIDSAKGTLQQAVSGLKAAADKTDLQKLYDDNKNKENSNYTEATWNAFQQALNTAKAALQNADSTQGQVDNAKAALDTARKGLTVKESPQPQAVEIKHEETGVTVTAPANVLPEGATLHVDVLSQGNGFQLAQNALSDVGSKLKVLDIYLLHAGKAIQPDGDITVRIPIPTGFDKTRLALYYIAADGKKTQLPIQIEGNEVVFHTTHFSTYALVETAASSSSQSGSDQNSSGQQTGGQSPQTGEAPLTIYFVVGAAAAFAVIVLLSRRKKGQEQK